MPNYNKYFDTEEDHERYMKSLNITADKVNEAVMNCDNKGWHKVDFTYMYNVAFCKDTCDHFKACTQHMETLNEFQKSLDK